MFKFIKTWRARHQRPGCATISGGIGTLDAEARGHAAVIGDGELLAERDAIILDRRQRNVLRAKELKAAGYKRPTQGIQLIPIPGEG